MEVYYWKSSPPRPSLSTLQVDKLIINIVMIIISLWGSRSSSSPSGHSCKICNMRCAGTLEEQNHPFKRQYECWLVLRCKHHTPWEKNDGPPYLTLWSLLSKSIEKSHVPAQQKQISSGCSLHKTYFLS